MPTHGTIIPLHPTGRQQSTSFEYTVREHLERLLHSSQFDASARSREFLRFVVDEALAGRGERLNQGLIAVTVFGRKDDFDAILDPIVRVQAGRLRRSLERYYLLTGDSESIHIELPKGGYAPVFVTTAARDGGRNATLKRVTLAEVASDWPTVAIHPLVASSSQDDEAAVRMMDELTMELGRYGDVRVVRQPDMDRLDLRQQASVRFEFQGSLRREADDCLISARLVDRTTGTQVWSDEYHTLPQAGRWSGSIDDVARVIAARIGAEHGVIARVLAGEYWVRRPDATGDFSAILRCYHFFFSRQVGELIIAVEALQRLTAREPEIAVAWTFLARLYLINHSYELTNLQTPIEKAITYAYQGVLLDPAGARVHCVLAAALLVKGELQAARDELEQALRLNPDSLAYREVIGWLMALAGDWERGLALMRDALARNPYCLPHVQHGLWGDHLRRGEFEQAYVAAIEYRDPTFFWRELMTACCLGHLGRLSEARASGAELLRTKPDFPQRGRTLIGYYIKSEELRERVMEGLRKAGVVLN
jgi:adenylate cyclase